jgi:RNA-directed DNA polymerase
MDIKESIAADLDIPVKLIHEAISVSRSQIKTFNINKRTGGKRQINHPSKKLKTIQYWLIYNVFKNLPVHQAAMAYRENRSIYDNAKYHKDNRFFLKIDLKDFFPSIKFCDLLPIVEKWHNASELNWPLNNDAKELIRLCCFFKNDALAIGYPSSPIISNLVMYDFDVSVAALISEERYENVLYTRYADDLVFSTNTKGACAELKNKLYKLIDECSSPKISVNKTKTKLSSSSGGSASVTGLRICKDGYITIHRKQKDHIRLLLSHYKKGLLNDEECRSLTGHLTYCHHVAPLFYSSLSMKYFMEIRELRSKKSI